MTDSGPVVASRFDHDQGGVPRALSSLFPAYLFPAYKEPPIGSLLIRGRYSSITITLPLEGIP